MSVRELVIIGSGGAGLSAAIESSREGLDVMMVTKSALGYSNTLYAQGGISASVSSQDSPELHYRDTRRCGNYRNVPALVSALVSDGQRTVKWLEKMGVAFDKDLDGRYALKTSAGATYPRILSCGDRTGAAIMKGLIGKMNRNRVKVLANTKVVDIRKRSGMFILGLKGGDFTEIGAKKVILASGGDCFRVAERGGGITSNCHDATGEISTVVSRLGVRKRNRYSYQFHPLGYALRGSLCGRPVPESLLWAGGNITSVEGIIDIRDLRGRGQLSRKMLEMAEQGRCFYGSGGCFFKLFIGKAVEQQGRRGLTRSYSILKEIKKHHPDIFEEGYIPVFPTLHYQNGGILIDENGRTNIKGIYAAGEITGGVHGTCRMMGNSLLDILCFGRRAGKTAIGE